MTAERADGADGRPTSLTTSALGSTALSMAHFNGALQHARRVHELEEEHGGDLVPEPILATQRGHVTACVMGAYAFLEALMNECFTRREPPLEEVALSKRVHLRELWSAVKREPAPRKAQLLLTALAGTRFDPREGPYYDVDLVRQLRDELVHHTPKLGSVVELPEHDVTGTDEGEQLREALADRFEPNPLADPAAFYFPDRCLGSGCAVWALESCRGFAVSFYERLGLEAPFSPRPSASDEEES